MNESMKIPMWKKIAYGCGAGGGNVMSTLLASFLLSYYTDTAGIAAAAIGTMFIVCRLLDGVTDFAMGGIVDKTNTKIGKARPWLIICAPLMVIGIILILSVPQGWGQAAKLVYAYITYIFLNCVVYTVFGIAHTALLARMTRDFKDRNTTSTVSSIVNNLSGLVIGTMITALQLNFGWTITGVILRAIGIGPMFAGLYAFCADAADYGEWKYGVRSEGFMASSQSIGSKIGIGFGSACTAWILAAAGYIQTAPGEVVTQPASVAKAIIFDYGWLGAIVSVILLMGVLLMDVEKYLPEIRASLGDKNSDTMN